LINRVTSYTAQKRAVSLILILAAFCSLAAPAFGLGIAVVVAESAFEAGELTGGGKNWSVRVEYGEEAQIPKNAALVAEELEGFGMESSDAQQPGVEETNPYYAAAEQIFAGERSVVAARFFDIEIRNEDGEKIEPESPVSVTIDAPSIDAANRVTVVHFPENRIDPVTEDSVFALGELFSGRRLLSEDPQSAEDGFFDREESFGKSEQPEQLEAPEFEQPVIELPEIEVVEAEVGDDGRITFSADSFSVYGLIYTADFRYEVNGRTYEFSIPGGGFVSLSRLAEQLGLAGDPDESGEADGETVSEAARAFVADVENVEFSDPTLVWVGKAGTSATVGQLKEAVGLECERSAELTEEQLLEIDAQTVNEGDWALIVLRPFLSEEVLTVTMTDGEVFDVAVTDAQIRTSVLSDGGELYEVTVTYGEDARIPEDARLTVTAYGEDSEEYARVRDTVLGQEAADPADRLRALDISIVGPDGEEIEPEAPVRVEMVIKRLGEDLAIVGDSLAVLHLDASSSDSEGVRVERVADTKETGIIRLNETDETASASFTLDSFSQFAVTYGSYVKVNVHYVDASGNELDGSTNGVTLTTDYWNPTRTLTLSDYANRMSQGNYTYLGAHYGTHSGQTITGMTASSAPSAGSLITSGQSVTFYNGTEIVARQEYESSLRQVDVYLVYAPLTGYYILDTIAADGCLTVRNGNADVVTGVQNNLFVRWYSSDNGTSGFTEVKQSKVLDGNYNIPVLGGPKVNVAIDEGADRYYKAQIYTVENNEEKVLATTAVYHVPYYDDVRNGGFETPHNDGRTNESVHKWPSNWQVENGQNGVVWKTTGTANDGTKRDIEIPQGAAANGSGANDLGETLRNYCFAFMPEGNQCAELNCEASGALYQDVLTIPGSQLYWSLYHRARGAYDTWKTKTDKTQNRETDTMYVVAMSTELAEKYDVTTQEKVSEVLKHVNDQNSEFHDAEIVKITTTNQGNGTITFMNSGASLTVPPTYFGNLADGATRTVHDSGTGLNFKYGNTDWHYYTGNFSIPSNQYLTRFFFVAGDTASHNATMGNFLDCIRLSDSVPEPNHGQATVIIKKTVTGLNALPENYATRIETTYKVIKFDGKISTVEKNSDYDSYRTVINDSGEAVSTASWTFPITIDNGDSITFTNGEETNPKNTAKTDEVAGYSRTTSYVIKKQANGQTEPTVVAEGSGKIIPEEEIQQLTVNEKDVITIEFINDYKPKYKVSVWKTDTAGNVIPTGASFELYRKEDCGTDGMPEEGAKYVASGTTGENGILYLGELEEGVYNLIETHAPDGYNMLTSPVTITVSGTTSGHVTAIQAEKPADIAVKDDETWAAGQEDGTYQIRVWNSSGVELPSTGGPGTILFLFSGSLLTLGAGWLLFRRSVRENRETA
jgi:hypothetical protein